ncbi:hypothetical protein GOODEAATRI_016925 [Goodea atripinnis]|uniref:Uncharacterized protein n=1 Tax=Goodea atripinnis TaxID=208336 RepID=A0ABV0PYM9_9TELE
MIYNMSHDLPSGTHRSEDKMTGGDIYHDTSCRVKLLNEEQFTHLWKKGGDGGFSKAGGFLSEDCDKPGVTAQQIHLWAVREPLLAGVRDPLTPGVTEPLLAGVKDPLTPGVGEYVLRGWEELIAHGGRVVVPPQSYSFYI